MEEKDSELMNLGTNSRGKKTKVFTIGLDGGTFDIISPLVEKGELPNFERVIKRGAWGKLESTIPPFLGPAWASFQTGKDPSNHGIFDFIEFEDKSMPSEEGLIKAKIRKLKSSEKI